MDVYLTDQPIIKRVTLVIITIITEVYYQEPVWPGKIKLELTSRIFN